MPKRARSDLSRAAVAAMEYAVSLQSLAVSSIRKEFLVENEDEPFAMTFDELMAVLEEPDEYVRAQQEAKMGEFILATIAQMEAQQAAQAAGQVQQ